MTHYMLVLRGVALYYYPGQNAYGWGPVSVSTGRQGVRVEWALRVEAESFVDRNRVFSAGAVITVT
jgi:hypothetical protein